MSLHKSVLLKEAIDGLDLRAGDIYLDATLGSGFHMEEVWRRSGGKVSLFGIDVDQMSLDIAKSNLDLSQVPARMARLNFRNIERAPKLLDMGEPSKILFDLGWNTPQFDTPEGELGRGFSFQKDEPLLMTLESKVLEGDTTAYDVVNSWGEENLADVIYGYGEERYARRIAKAIVERRKEKPILSSKELADLVKSVVPIFYRFGRIHPATKTFQAIRIAVNDELRALEDGLHGAFKILRENGRIAVISFHSLEDRIVKNFFKNKKEELKAKIINKKPITPSEVEISANPRSRSAKLRIIQKL
ncbi:MAG TPA: 16S rRNA (cytosine(1402)-N(4))-methyltransferase RsmH [Candidatus Paceibacterota bacterium]